MALLGRIIVIIFAVFLASLAAGMAIAAGLLGPEWNGFTGDIGERVGFWAVTVFAVGFTGAVGLVPLVILLAVAEAYKIRSLLIYACAGAAMFALGYYGSGVPQSYDESIDHAPPPISRPAELAAAAGVVFGFIYWVIAGRKAGVWRGV
ncbi:MAG TPA: hypothetical protein VHV58_03550 [Pseudolabrys sp.]|nr:hypothetical protein [Pseudolabrys sp.]